MNSHNLMIIKLAYMLVGLSTASLAYSSSPAGERRFKSSFNPDRNEFVTTSYSVGMSYPPPEAKMILRRHNHQGNTIGMETLIDISIHGGSEYGGTHAIDFLNKKILLAYCAAKNEFGTLSYSLQYQMHRLNDFGYIANSNKEIYKGSSWQDNCNHEDAEYHKGLGLYLIAWRSNSSISGQFIDALGEPSGAPFVIASAANSSVFRIVADQKVGGKFYVLYFNNQTALLSVVGTNQVPLETTITLPNPASHQTQSGDLVYNSADQSLLFLAQHSYYDSGLLNYVCRSDTYRIDLSGIEPSAQTPALFGFAFPQPCHPTTRINAVLNQKIQSIELFTNEPVPQSNPPAYAIRHRSFSLNRAPAQDIGPSSLVPDTTYPNYFDSKAAVNTLCGNFLIASSKMINNAFVYTDSKRGPICQPSVSKDQANVTFAPAFVGSKLPPKTIKFRADLIDTTFGAASLTGTHANTFKITADTCSNAAVLFKGECAVSVAPLGANAGQFEAQLLVPVTGGNAQSVTIKSTFSPPRVIKSIAPDTKATDVRSQKTHLIWEATTETQGGQYKVTICENPNGVDCKILTQPILRQP